VRDFCVYTIIMDLPIYEITAENGGFFYRASIVDTPAIEMEGIHFNKEVEEMKFKADEEKRLFYAPALIPNKMIFRKDVKGSPANTYYTAETIEMLNESYFKNICNSETNINHEANPTEGIYPVESWIVHDNKNDKANALGFDVPNGTLMMCHKVDNDEVWDRIKKGDLTGLSVEMLANYQLKPQIKMNTEEEKKGFVAEIIDAIKMAFEPKKTEEEAVAEGEPVVEETAKIADTENEALKVENEALKAQLKEATDKLAEYEIQNTDMQTKSVLMEKEVEELKSKIAFNSEIPKVPTVTKSFDEMTPLERAKKMYN
jgi:hypothetical protein